MQAEISWTKFLEMISICARAERFVHSQWFVCLFLHFLCKVFPPPGRPCQHSDRDKEQAHTEARSEKGNGQKSETRNQSIPIHYARENPKKKREQQETFQEAIHQFEQHHHRRSWLPQSLGPANHFDPRRGNIKKTIKFLKSPEPLCVSIPISTRTFNQRNLILFTLVIHAKSTNTNAPPDSQPVIMIPRSYRKEKHFWRSIEDHAALQVFFFSSCSRESFFSRVIELIKKFLNLQAPTPTPSSIVLIHTSNNDNFW